VGIALVALASGSRSHAQSAPPQPPPAQAAPAQAPTEHDVTAPARPTLIPWPVSVTLSPSERFAITKDTVIEVSPGQAELSRIARELADLLRPSMEATLSIREATGSAGAGVLRLEVGTVSDATGSEAYEITITPAGARILGSSAAGVFYGVQTFRQLLPWSVELRGARPRDVSVPTGHIVDRPRFEWRGAMLDVARHFFGPADIRHYIDLLAMYKFNHLHLHLSDDQGWRIEISSWPKLTTIGSTVAVNGGAGGFYTKQDYADLIAYARDRFITIVPEIDMPTHINAALSSYPELNCNGVAPPLYTGIEVGFSSFCLDKDVTYKFIDDVVREIAALTPGPFFHIGGDEVKTITQAQYNQFIERVQGIVHANGKRVIGWDEIIHAKLLPDTVVQYWRPDASLKPAPGTKLVISPANKIYLDMKYDDATVLGQNWAGNVAVPVAYNWDPATLLPGVDPASILGIETALWSETPATMDDIEFLAFPRLACVAEVAWSPQAGRQWDEFRIRLGAQAPRWSALGINAYWAPIVPWQR
jgi:hexosaminidase